MSVDILLLQVKEFPSQNARSNNEEILLSTGRQSIDYYFFIYIFCVDNIKINGLRRQYLSKVINKEGVRSKFLNDIGKIKCTSS